jgi:hypothetical protein
MGRIERLLIVAGPTAAGKSTLLDRLAADPLFFEQKLGIENLREWPRIGANRLVTPPTDGRIDGLIVHYDFLWAPGHSPTPVPLTARAGSLVREAREVCVVTLWTPAERLLRQLIKGKLRAAAPPGMGQEAKAALFRLLPNAAIRCLAAAAPLGRLNRCLPARQLLHHLSLLPIYSRPERVAAVYRRWFEICDADMSVKHHAVVECDKAVAFYSRDEWEARSQVRPP